MTLIDFSMFRNIQVSELLNQAWAKTGKETRSPNILAVIGRFNKISQWMINLILSNKEPEDRAKTISYFILVAKKLQLLNNYAGLMSLLTGFGSSSIQRLKLTWPLVTKMKIYTELKEVMSFEGSYKNYRDSLKAIPSNFPCVPFIAPFLSDLTFIDENPDEYQGLINMMKRQLISEAVDKIYMYQKVPYYLEPVVVIQTVLLHLSVPTDAELYNMSLKLEPRGASEIPRERTLTKSLSRKFFTSMSNQNPSS